MTCQDVLLVGAGLEAQRCAETLRARGFDGLVRAICTCVPLSCASASPPAPYVRSPLSNEALALPPASPPFLRPPGWHEDNDVDLLLGDAAVGLDDGRVHLASGASVPYGKLLVA